MIDRPEDMPSLPAPRRRGGRVALLSLALIAVIAVAAYVLGARDLPRISLHHAAAPAVAPTAPSPSPEAPPDPRIDALNSDVRSLRQRVETLEQRSAPVLPASPAYAATPPTDASAARIDALAERLRAAEARLDTLANQAGAMPALAQRTARLAQLQAATAALANGQPLGDMPDEPPALARFRTAAPPVEAQLRHEFPSAAAAARRAARPDEASGFWRSVRARLAGLITIRDGGHMVVGSAQAAAIDTAADALNAGDLSAAVAALASLDGPAAASIADWKGRAQALLDARAALAALAAHA